MAEAAQVSQATVSYVLNNKSLTRNPKRPDAVFSKPPAS
ncbi:hypothetical protein ABZ622_38040 [Streptomyces sp. NPDC007164]